MIAGRVIPTWGRGAGRDDATVPRAEPERGATVRKLAPGDGLLPGLPGANARLLHLDIAVDARLTAEAHGLLEGAATALTD